MLRNNFNEGIYSPYTKLEILVFVLVKIILDFNFDIIKNNWEFTEQYNYLTQKVIRHFPLFFGDL